MNGKLDGWTTICSGDVKVTKKKILRNDSAENYKLQNNQITFEIEPN